MQQGHKDVFGTWDVGMREIWNARCVYGDMGLRDGDVGMQDTGRRDVELRTWGRMIGVMGT